MTITVLGRRWFQKSYGNTYNTAEILVDGASVARLPMAYGYGDFFLQRAADELETRGLMPGREHYEKSGGAEPLWLYCNRNAITFVYRVTDVTRQKDL